VVIGKSFFFKGLLTLHRKCGQKSDFQVDEIAPINLRAENHGENAKQLKLKP
jgi:hypothetical protein